jgi:hypothetical protein
VWCPRRFALVATKDQARDQAGTKDPQGPLYLEEGTVGGDTGEAIHDHFYTHFIIAWVLETMRQQAQQI